MRILMFIAAFVFYFFPTLTGTSARADSVPKTRLEFRIKLEELRNLHELLARFAVKERMRLSDLGAQMPPIHGRPLFYVELDRDNDIEVDINNIAAEDRMFVWVYEFQPGPRSRDIEMKLEEALRSKWPSLAPYEGS
jgi:hypothetical protein